MSKPGLPKLNALARSGQFARKLRLKGKGHEFTDAARLLTFYQLWLDDLYPRAKFADALQLVEKAGHSKSMQRQRREWIDEGKPDYIRERERRKQREAESESAYGEITMSGGLGVQNDQKGTDTGPNTGNTNSDSRLAPKPVFESRADIDKDGLFFPATTETSKVQDDGPDDDELEALLAEQGSKAEPPKPSEDESEGEDDLDALLSKQVPRRGPGGKERNAPANSMFEEDEDELDALLAEHEAERTPIRNSGSAPRDCGPQTTLANIVGIGNEEAKVNEDEDDREEIQDHDQYRNREEFGPSPPQRANNAGDSQGHNSHLDQLSSPIPNEDLEEDDLTAVVAERDQNEDAPLPTSTRARGQTSPEPSETEEPSLPDIPGELGPKDDSQGREGGILFSSSPIPNDVLEMDDLDALLDEQDRKDNVG